VRSSNKIAAVTKEATQTMNDEDEDAYYKTLKAQENSDD